MNLTDISKTAIMTLAQRAVEMESKDPIISDPMTLLCLEELLKKVTEQERRQILEWKKIYKHGFGAISRKGVAIRVKTIDCLVKDFLTKRPFATVVELASGFDTRFWRVNNDKFRFIEIDLPEVISLKKELLKGHFTHELMGHSVLDFSWIEKITSRGNSDFLIVAEGLFMYIPPSEIRKLFERISNGFEKSQMIFDVVSKFQTQGFWKKLVNLGFKKKFGLDVSFEFGLKKTSEIETYSKSFNVVGTHKGTYGPIILASINN
jgi:methyltransferase (TIGR00027 family)